MTHCDPDTLALAALGESIPSLDAEHLESCAQCQDEVAELGSLVSLAREAPHGLTPAPDRVWRAIQAELGLEGASDAPGLANADVIGSSGRSDQDQPRENASAQVVRLRSRRRLVGVAAVAAMVGAILGGAVIWATIGRTPGETRQDTIIAQAVLEPLSPTVTEPGKAQVLETPDGLVVRVDARGLPPSTGFHEVWLLDADATRLVSLGALPSGSIGTFTVPPGVQVTDFPVVDISLEPYDGNPEHSHDSLLRGVLET